VQDILEMAVAQIDTLMERHGEAVNVGHFMAAFSRISYLAVELRGPRPRCVGTHRFLATNLTEQYGDIEFIYCLTHPNGKEEGSIQAFQFRRFFRYEVEHLLARCRYGVIQVFGNFDESPLGDNFPEIILVAEKEKEFSRCHTSEKKPSRE
jgi:hypothetical protein